MASPKPLLVICGPSGVGKSVLLRALLGRHGKRVACAVSHTSRAPRAGEVDGIAYHFSTREEMEALRSRGEFVEHAVVHGNIYGTSRGALEDVQRAGKVCLLDVDVQGVRSIRRAALDCQAVMLRPPSREALAAQLAGRGTEEEEALRRRLANAEAELSSASEELDGKPLCVARSTTGIGRQTWQNLTRPRPQV